VSTASKLIDDTLGFLRNYVQDQEQSTHLVDAVDASETVWNVGQGAGVISRGRLEVEDEIVFVESFSGNTITIAPYGRGYDGTTAAAHDVNARLVYNPPVPRHSVLVALNDTLRQVGATLDCYGVTTFTDSSNIITYALPAEAQEIIKVTYDALGSTAQWPEIRSWSINFNANTTTWPTGKTIDLYTGPGGGRTVQVVYTKQPTVLALGDDFTDSGLPATAEEVVKLGACARLVLSADAGKLNTNAVGAHALNERSPAGSAVTISRYLQALYQQALDLERRRQHNQYNAGINWEL